MSVSLERSNRASIISALLAGFIAGFIWMAITVLVGTFTAAAIVGWGIFFLGGTAIVTFFISGIISRSHSR
ncbi:hypothetical protein [Arthrobacter sp. E3]|uniref:hypothetical protein n=1 Tax=Arthrobacter sp. E3 TaxID=517402 RepID=UPI001A9523CC|nr:hypothetical protein [Arthrobacter sp. E3]